MSGGIFDMLAPITSFLGPLGPALGAVSSISGMIGGGNKSEAPSSPQEAPKPPPYVASRQAQAALPGSLSQFGGLDQNQLSTNIATKGVYGGGEGPEETKYFTNLINRRLVDDTGKMSGDLNGINPVENSFLSQLGLGGNKSPYDLLKGINDYKFS